MGDLLHNSHLRLNFLVEYSILHEPAFFKFLGGEGYTIKLFCDLIYRCECTFSNDTHTVVLRATFPFFWLSASNVRLCGLEGRNISQGIWKEVDLSSVNSLLQVSLYRILTGPPVSAASNALARAFLSSETAFKRSKKSARFWSYAISCTPSR